MTDAPLLGPTEIFILFFVTLGPLKLLGPFVQQTRELEPAALRAIALRAFVLGSVAAVVGGYVGMLLAHKWHLSLPAIEITAGLILLLVALGIVMSAYGPPPEAAQPLPAAPMAATLRLTFPQVLTPYGIAVVIALLAAAHGDTERQTLIFALLIAVMVLNLLAMLYARSIMRGVMLLILQVLGAVLGVLQVALAIQIMLGALRQLGVISG